MSIEVPLTELAATVEAQGFCYLVTVSDDDRPHLLALRPVVDDSEGELRLSFDAGGGRACRNASARPHVSLVFPPDEPAGMSLVVDGAATVDEAIVHVSPTWAVWHRAAPSN